MLINLFINFRLFFSLSPPLSSSLLVIILARKNVIDSQKNDKLLITPWFKYWVKGRPIIGEARLTRGAGNCNIWVKMHNIFYYLILVMWLFNLWCDIQLLIMFIFAALAELMLPILCAELKRTLELVSLATW